MANNSFVILFCTLWRELITRWGQKKSLCGMIWADDNDLWWQGGQKTKTPQHFWWEMLLFLSLLIKSVDWWVQVKIMLHKWWKRDLLSSITVLGDCSLQGTLVHSFFFQFQYILLNVLNHSNHNYFISVFLWFKKECCHLLLWVWFM